MDRLEEDNRLDETVEESINEASGADSTGEAAPEEPAGAEPEEVVEDIPSMDEFKDELAQSFRKLEPGDIVQGEVIGVSDTEVTVDLGSYSEGIIKLEELSNDPRFSIKADIKVGDKVSATVLRENREGSILLSMKQADDILAWDELKRMKEEKTIVTVKIASAVKAGVTTFLKGIRAFIPASQLALSYVEDLDSYVNQTVDVVVWDIDVEKKKLILSAKEVARDRAVADRNSRISKLQKGLVTSGKVEKLMPFGAFVNIGGDLSGLVHVSQICGRRIKSPGEVLKVGDEVTVKIIDIKEGKISLSMKAVGEKEDVLGDAVDDAAQSYSDGRSTGTGLGDLLAKLKL